MMTKPLSLFLVVMATIATVCFADVRGNNGEVYERTQTQQHPPIHEVRLTPGKTNFFLDIHNTINNVRDRFRALSPSSPSVTVGSSNKDKEENRRVLKSSKAKESKRSKKNSNSNNLFNNDSKKELDGCKQELMQCNKQLDKELNRESDMFVQMGSECLLRRMSEGVYHLVVQKMNKETWVFSDRPFRHEETMHTETFVETFDATFGDIPPNAAVTFNDDTTMGTDAPLISVFVDAAVLDGDYEGDDNTTIPLMYTIEQRENQASFAALESYFGEPDGETSVEFESCSLFIDSVPAMSRCHMVDGQTYTFFSKKEKDHVWTAPFDCCHRCFIKLTKAEIYNEKQQWIWRESTKTIESVGCQDMVVNVRGGTCNGREVIQLYPKSSTPTPNEQWELVPQWEQNNRWDKEWVWCRFSSIKCQNDVVTNWAKTININKNGDDGHTDELHVWYNNGKICATDDDPFKVCNDDALFDIAPVKPIDGRKIVWNWVGPGYFKNYAPSVWHAKYCDSGEPVYLKHNSYFNEGDTYIPDQQWIWNVDKTIESAACPGKIVTIKDGNCKDGTVIQLSPKEGPFDDGSEKWDIGVQEIGTYIRESMGEYYYITNQKCGNTHTISRDGSGPGDELYETCTFEGCNWDFGSFYKSECKVKPKAFSCRPLHIWNDGKKEDALFNFTYV